jgi:hypothetical protein
MVVTFGGGAARYSIEQGIEEERDHVAERRQVADGMFAAAVSSYPMVFRISRHEWPTVRFTG